VSETSDFMMDEALAQEMHHSIDKCSIDTSISLISPSFEAPQNVSTTAQTSTTSLANLMFAQNSGNGGNKHESIESY
jgi:hypothetical protein